MGRGGGGGLLSAITPAISGIGGLATNNGALKSIQKGAKDVYQNENLKKFGGLVTGMTGNINRVSEFGEKKADQRRAGQEVVRQQATADTNIKNANFQESQELDQRAGIARRRQNRIRSAYGGGSSLLGGSSQPGMKTLLGA